MFLFFLQPNPCVTTALENEKICSRQVVALNGHSVYQSLKKTGTS